MHGQMLKYTTQSPSRYYLINRNTGSIFKEMESVSSYTALPVCWLIFPLLAFPSVYFTLCQKTEPSGLSVS